jgi:hypothetical protein
VTLTLEEATGKSVVLLPIGGCDDSAHSAGACECGRLRSNSAMVTPGSLIEASPLSRSVHPSSGALFITLAQRR